MKTTTYKTISKILLISVIAILSVSCEGLFDLIKYGGNDRIDESTVTIYNLRYHAYKDDQGKEQTEMLALHGLSAKTSYTGEKTIGYDFIGSRPYKTTGLSKKETIEEIDYKYEYGQGGDYSWGKFVYYYKFPKGEAEGSEAFVDFDFDSMSYGYVYPEIEETGLSTSGKQFTKKELIDAINSVKIKKGYDVFIYIEQDDVGGRPKVSYRYELFANQNFRF